MKALRFPLFSVLLAVAIAVPTAAYAAGKKKPAKKKEYVPIHRTIRAVSDTSITVSDGIQTMTYAIIPRTVVDIKGNRKTVKDLQVGMKVSVSTGVAINIAERISADDPPKAPPKTDKKKK